MTLPDGRGGAAAVASSVAHWPERQRQPTPTVDYFITEASFVRSTTAQHRSAPLGTTQPHLHYLQFNLCCAKQMANKKTFLLIFTLQKNGISLQVVAVAPQMLGSRLSAHCMPKCVVMCRAIDGCNT